MKNLKTSIVLTISVVTICLLCGVVMSCGDDDDDGALPTPTPQIVFQKIFGGAQEDAFRSICQTRDDGYIMCGYSKSDSAGEKDYFIVKTDAYGEEMWSLTFGAEEDERANSIREDEDGYLTICGGTNYDVHGKSDVSFMKITAGGETVWSRTYGGGKWDAGKHHISVADGFVLCGSTASWGNGSDDVYVLKVDAEGNELWSRTFGGPYSDIANFVSQTNDGGYIICGSYQPTSVEEYDYLVIKLNSLGVEEWSKTFEGRGNDIARSVVQVTEGNYLVCGGSQTSDANERDIWVLTLDQSGQVLRQNFYGQAGDEAGRIIIPADDGTFCIAGSDEDPQSGEVSVSLINIDTLGSEVWSQHYGPYSAFSAIATADGGFALCGATAVYDSPNADAFLIKTDTMGNSN